MNATTITKNEVRKIAIAHECQARYSGKTKTMYIRGGKAGDVYEAVGRRNIGHFAILNANFMKS